MSACTFAMAEESNRFWEKTSINVIVNVIRTIITALVGVLLVPYYIDELGMAVYGVIPLATATTSYIMIISDALVAACSRYTVIAIQRGDTDEVSRAFNTALIGVGRNLLLLIPVVVVFSYLSPYIFTVDEGAILDVQVMFLLVLLSAVLVTFSSAFNSIFSAFNKLYLLYIARTIYLAVQVLIIVVMFNLGTPSLIDVGLAYAVSSVCLFLFVAIYSLRLVPGLRVSKADYSPELFKEMGALGVWTIVLKMGSLLFIQVSLIITNIYLGSEVEGGFAIIASLLSMVNTACYSFVTAISPLAFKHFADGERDKLISMYHTALKFISLVFAFPVAYIFIFSGQILTAWVGAEYQYLSGLAIIGFIAELAFCAGTVLEDLPIVFLKVREVGIATVFFGIINIALAVLFVNFTEWGAQGIIAGWTISTLGLNMFLFCFDARAIGSSVSKFLIPVLEGYAVTGILLVITDVFSSFVTVNGTWISVIFWFFVTFTIYFIFMMSLMMNHDDKCMIASAIPSSIRKFIPRFMIE